MNLVSVGAEIKMSYNVKLIFRMGKITDDGVHHVFNLEIFVHLIMAVKCIDMDLLVKVDTALKYIILSKMMIVVWLYLRSFVHFLAVKYSWEIQLLFLSAERKW